MKRIGITQRVESIETYKEKRDCLDQRWFSLVLALNCIPVPLPNIEPEYVSQLLDALQLQGVIFSGGNTLTEVDKAAPDAAPERDNFEAALIDECMKRSLPILGICRGMQMINLHFGGGLVPVENHIATEHAIQFDGNLASILSSSVNSYHGWGISASELATTLRPIATDPDGYVEAFVHRKEKLTGIMWHPEREEPLKSEDLNLIRKYLL